MLNRSAVAIALALLMPLAACGGGPEVTEANGDQSATKTEQAQEVKEEEIRTYFEALASSDPDEMAEAAELAASDSIAAAYAKHQSNLSNAALDAGIPYEEETLEPVDGGYDTCGTDEEGGEVCFTYADLESSGGKLSSFTVNGEPIDDRISLGNGEKVKAGNLGSVEFLSAYKAAENDLFIAVKFTTTKRTGAAFGGFEATYRSPEGRQSKAANLIGTTDVEADSTSFEVLVFPRAEPGGTATIPIYTADYFGDTKVKIKTR